jgi:MOSC domain-containing protein YiiM
MRRASSSAGTVYELHRKPAVEGEHGIPKAVVPEVVVTRHGVSGDFNRYREEDKGGTDDQALLLLPLETLEQLNREGWPVRPGDLGENVTIRGLPYDALAPTRRVRIGAVVAETSKACTPCHYLHSLPYVGEAKGPQFVRTLIDRRGWFARVLTPGTIRPGDRVELLD